eukprot:Gb_33415 [translate_table: standard]
MRRNCSRFITGAFWGHLPCDRVILREAPLARAKINAAAVGGEGIRGGSHNAASFLLRNRINSFPRFCLPIKSAGPIVLRRTRRSARARAAAAACPPSPSNVGASSRFYACINRQPATGMHEWLQAFSKLGAGVGGAKFSQMEERRAAPKMLDKTRSVEGSAPLLMLNRHQLEEKEEISQEKGDLVSLGWMRAVVSAQYEWFWQTIEGPCCSCVRVKMQNGAITLAAQMEERKTRSLSSYSGGRDSWTKLLDSGTDLVENTLPLLNSQSIWDHLRTPSSVPMYNMQSSTTSGEIRTLKEFKEGLLNTGRLRGIMSQQGDDISLGRHNSVEQNISGMDRFNSLARGTDAWSTSSFCNNGSEAPSIEAFRQGMNVADLERLSGYNNGKGNGSNGKINVFEGLNVAAESFSGGSFTRLLDPSSTMPCSDSLDIDDFPTSNKVSAQPLPLKPNFQSSNILTFHSNMSKLDMAYPAPKASVQHQKSGLGSPSDSSSTSSSNNTLQKSTERVDEGGESTTEQKRSSDQAGLSNNAFKKPRTEVSTSAPMKVISPSKPLNVRKEKLGERITALQQLVSPFGKTDTASVLLEAMGYIKFLQDQIQVLSTPYLKGIPSSQNEGRGDQAKYDLRSRGLCLVPVSCTPHVANNNGADFWTSGIGSGSKF